MKCIDGYSLDGKKRVEGGTDTNGQFSIRCNALLKKWELAHAPMAGVTKMADVHCESFKFVSGAKMFKAFELVIDSLFVADCKNKLTHQAKNEKEVGADW